MLKKKTAEKAANHERWLLTYADLITLLLVFFVVMYAMSNADLEKFAQLSGSVREAFNIGVLQGVGGTAPQTKSGGPTDTATSLSTLSQLLNALRSDIARFVKDADVSSDTGSVGVYLSAEGVTVTVTGALVFDSGKATIKPESYPLLQAVTARVRSLPNEIKVEGHTDNIPIKTSVYGSNWELSAARSVAIVRFFQENGIEPSRLSATGFGEYRPVADNADREGRAMNRRVDITIIFRAAPLGDLSESPTSPPAQ